MDDKAISTPHPAIALYLDLLKGVLTRTMLPERFAPFTRQSARADELIHAAREELKEPSLVFARGNAFNPAARDVGKDWPSEAETMIGTQRLNHLQFCVEDVLQRRVSGDLIETGVWRGGATILMRGILKAYGDATRNVWVADSFQGLPRPDAEKYPADTGDKHWTHPELAIGVEQVRANFARYGLLDEQVKFLVGWFRDTLPTAPIERLAVMRLDGDMYESTMDGLRNLYPKLSPGGYCIIDDYGCVKGCKQAVADYRAEQGITEPIAMIDWTGAWWRKG